MTSKQVTVTKYVSFDGKEFDNCDKCRAYEQEENVKLWGEISASRQLISTLKEKANEDRLRFMLARCDAQEALGNKVMITFHKKMAEFYEGKVAYNVHKSGLYVERRHLKELMDKAFVWFGERKHKSSLAKWQRFQKSLRWRQENTPDKWRTPNKIRVSKLQKEG